MQLAATSRYSLQIYERSVNDRAYNHISPVQMRCAVKTPGQFCFPLSSWFFHRSPGWGSNVDFLNQHSRCQSNFSGSQFSVLQKYVYSNVALAMESAEDSGNSVTPVCRDLPLVHWDCVVLWLSIPTGWIILVILRHNAKSGLVALITWLTGQRIPETAAARFRCRVHFQKYARALFARSSSIISTLNGTIWSTRKTDAALGGNLRRDFAVRFPIIRIRIQLQSETWLLRFAKRQFFVGRKGLRTVCAFDVFRAFLKALLQSSWGFLRLPTRRDDVGDSEDFWNDWPCSSIAEDVCSTEGAQCRSAALRMLRSIFNSISSSVLHVEMNEKTAPMMCECLKVNQVAPVGRYFRFIDFGWQYTICSFLHRVVGRRSVILVCQDFEFMPPRAPHVFAYLHLQIRAEPVFEDLGHGLTLGNGSVVEWRIVYRVILNNSCFFFLNWLMRLYYNLTNELRKK